MSACDEQPCDALKALIDMFEHARANAECTQEFCDALIVSADYHEAEQRHKPIASSGMIPMHPAVARELARAWLTVHVYRH
jgi:hypothetical protein